MYVYIAESSFFLQNNLLQSCCIVIAESHNEAIVIVLDIKAYSAKTEASHDNIMAATIRHPGAGK